MDDQQVRHTIEARTSAYTREGALLVRDELARLFNDLHKRGITHRGFSIGADYKGGGALATRPDTQRETCGDGPATPGSDDH